MANLQIKGMDDRLYEEVRKLAASEQRSVSQQVLFLVKDYLASRKPLGTLRTPAEVLLALSGSWEDEREPEEIIQEIKADRKNSKKLSRGF